MPVQHRRWVVIADGLGGDRADAAGQRVDRALAVGVQAVAEKDDEQLAFGIDPHGGAGEAAVSERPRRERLAAIRGVAGLAVPTEAAKAAGDSIPASHRLDGARLQDADAVALTAIEHHLGVDGKVVGRREQPRVSRNAAEQVRPGVVYLASHPPVVALLGRGGTRAQRLGRQIARGGHSQGPKDVLSRELVHVLARDPPDELSQHQISHVGVDELRPRRRGRLEREDSAPGLLGAVAVVVQRVVGDQPALVRQQLEDGDLLLSVLSEFGDVPRHRIARVGASLAPRGS